MREDRRGPARGIQYRFFCAWLRFQLEVHLRDDLVRVGTEPQEMQFAVFAEPEPVRIDDHASATIAIALAPDGFWGLVSLKLDAANIGIGRVASAAGIQPILMQ